jgi:hypothetical protein
MSQNIRISSQRASYYMQKLKKEQQVDIKLENLKKGGGLLIGGYSWSIVHGGKVVDIPYGSKLIYDSGWCVYIY